MSRNTYLDAFLGTVDFRSPASLLEAAAQLEATLPIQEKRIEAKERELRAMKSARNEVETLAKQLRTEAARLRKREDFEGTDFETANRGRIQDQRDRQNLPVNPEVSNR